MRRVVTGVGPDGRSRVAIDDDAADHDFVYIPGMTETLVWATLPGDRIDGSGVDPVPGLRHDLAGPGETRFHCITFPPDQVYASAEFDPERAAEEQARVTPELAALFETDHPGVHTTQTVDYVIVLDGSIVLELDEGSVSLTRGDVVVQNATRHAWRNPSDRPATLAVVSVGPPVQRTRRTARSRS
jgi:mannose-6-phosphate isomerase-like protein (cupin superfamily)